MYGKPDEENIKRLQVVPDDPDLRLIQVDVEVVQDALGERSLTIAVADPVDFDVYHQRSTDARKESRQGSIPGTAAWTPLATRAASTHLSVSPGR